MSWRKRLSFASVVLLCAFIGIASYYMYVDRTSTVKSSSPYGIDYEMYYTAGRIHIENPSENLYDASLHNQTMERIFNRTPPPSSWWIYPPTFLLAIVPLSYLPYPVSIAAWIAITLAIMILSAFALLPKSKNIALLVCGFPGVLLNLRWGQNAFLSTGLLGFGLAYMDTKPVLSGLMFGLLTYKPQLAAFPLLMLLLCKKWKVLFWSVLFGLAAAGLSALLFGFGVWKDFIHSFLYSTSNMMSSAWSNLSAIQPSFYSVFRLAGFSTQWTYVLIGIIALLTILMVWCIARSTESMALRGSAFVLGILLSVPYYIQYDLMILAIPLILLAYDCFERGHQSWEIAILIALWIMPLINWPLTALTGIQICPFVVLVTLLMTMLRAKQMNRMNSCSALKGYAKR